VKPERDTLDTFLLTLPDGKRVRCWKKDAADIRRDVTMRGTVYLIRDPETEVYDRVAPDSVEATFMEDGGARRVD
jgi:hypothetical protein